MKKLGHRCLATGSSETKIYIPNSISKPPIFTISGRTSDEKSYPFGKPEEKIQIYVPSSLYEDYYKDRYWKKYIKNMIQYKDNQIEIDGDSDYQIDSDDIPSIDIE